jgi:hypothetical protein
MAKKAARKAKATPRRKAAPRRAAGATKKRSTAPKRQKAAKKAKAGKKKPAPKAKARAKARVSRPKAKAASAKRSTGSPAGAGDSRRAPSLDRARKQLREVEESVPQAPSSLNMDRHGSAARSGRAAIRQAKQRHTNISPAITGGDVDADWEDAYAVGDEAPGGDNPTPDQDRVDDIGRALGIEYADNEELKGSDKVAGRDKHRWELDPASAEDYPDHEE